ncbi:hypothetical protein PIB30_021249 [Stylosanthes scabra]|uniref:Uncharacterized protein n=1 Tax=Stylosanthes scabra TaxID=79078 RepID=A0ABU6W743_9FABA|nr:hypothetical protein [Stylosanthes scabra]
MNDEKIGGMLDPFDEQKIEKVVNDVIEWIEGNQLAQVDEFEDKLKELKGLCNPIIAKMYQGGGGDVSMEGTIFWKFFIWAKRERVSKELLQELLWSKSNIIHHRLPIVITFDPELRLTHRLRLHEALSIIFDSIPHESCGCRIGVLGYSMTRRKSRVCIELGVQFWHFIRIENPWVGDSHSVYIIRLFRYRFKFGKSAKRSFGFFESSISFSCHKSPSSEIAIGSLES